MCSNMRLEVRTFKVHLSTAIIGTDVRFGSFTWWRAQVVSLHLSAASQERCCCHYWNYWHIVSKFGEEIPISRGKDYHLTRR